MSWPALRWRRGGSCLRLVKCGSHRRLRNATRFEAGGADLDPSDRSVQDDGGVLQIWSELSKIHPDGSPSNPTLLLEHPAVSHLAPNHGPLATQFTLSHLSSLLKVL